MQPSVSPADNLVYGCHGVAVQRKTANGNMGAVLHISPDGCCDGHDLAGVAFHILPGIVLEGFKSFSGSLQDFKKPSGLFTIGFMRITPFYSGF
jgi:hypothetical protein